MTYEEKFEIVVSAIKEASRMTPSGYNTKLKITNENKLQDLDLDDISSILYQLQNDQKVIKMISTANTNFITGLDPWSDEQDYFALDVLDTFGDWYASHTLKHKSSLENLTFINFLKIYDTLLAIEEEYEITRNVKVVIPLLPSVMRFSALFPGDTIGTRNKYMDDRLKSCDYLKAEGVLKEAGLVAPHQSYDSEVGITINSVNFYPFVKRAKAFYIAHSQTDKESAKENKPITEPKPVKGTDVVYEITFSQKTGILFNGIQIAKPDWESENEIVFNFLYNHPNKKHTQVEIEAAIKRKVSKSLHKIVENLGFVGDLKKVFIDANKDSICFKNPITQEDLEKLGIVRIKLPK